ncbi:MAG: O-antigen ligase family protein [Acidobacteriaceae bacterium]
MIVVVKLYAPPSAITGLSIKNIVLYVVCIAILLSYMDRLSLLKSLPGAGAVVVLLAFAPLSMLYAPVLAGGARLVPFYMLADYKNELFDPFLLYGIGFLLTARPEAGLRPLRAIVVTFGLLNVLALSFYVTGINPFYQNVLSQQHTRFASYGIYSNQGAYSLAMFLPLTYYLYVYARAGGARLFYLFLMLTSIAGIALSGSRGAGLALVAEFFLLMIWTRRYGFFLRVFALGTIGVIAFAAVTHGHFLRDAIDRLRVFAGTHSTDQMLRSEGFSTLDIISSGRTFVWGAILQLFELHPLALFVGFGWGTYQAHIFRLLGTIIATHNVFLTMWAELGLTGLFIMAWLGRAVLRSYRLHVRPYDRLLYQCILTAIFIVVWTFMLSAPINVYVIWSFTFGVLAGYGRNSRLRSEMRASARTAEKPHDRHETPGTAAQTYRRAR